MAIITATSDPVLWAVLYDEYVAQHNPRNITLNTDIYACVTHFDGTIEFHTVEPIDYIDSRSLTHSRGASYNNLDG